MGAAEEAGESLPRWGSSAAVAAAGCEGALLIEDGMRAFKEAVNYQFSKPVMEAIMQNWPGSDEGAWHCCLISLHAYIFFPCRTLHLRSPSLLTQVAEPLGAMILGQFLPLLIYPAKSPSSTQNLPLTHCNILNLHSLFFEGLCSSWFCSMCSAQYCRLEEFLN